jgi:hypothetical protein
MKKRLIPLLVFTIVLAVAPAAIANHCERCRPVIQDCAIFSNFGYELCYWDAAGCHVETPCGDHATAPDDLASEFTVASVERVDESQAAASETLVASLETPKQATR